MDSYPVTDALLDWLDRKGMRGNGAGTPALHVNSAEKGRGTWPRQFQGGGNNVRPDGRKVRTEQEPCPAREGRPVLKLVCSNKDVRRHNPTSKAPLGLRTSLVLVK